MIIRRPYSKLCRKTAFTLVEVMAAIAVVLVLASIAFYAFGRSRQFTESINCVNNLRILSSAMHLYITDMELEVVTRTGGAGQGGGSMWAAELSGRGYLRENVREKKHYTYTWEDPKIVACPTGRLPDSLTDQNWQWFTYGINLFTPGGRTVTEASTQLHKRNVADVDSAKLVLLADSLSGPDGTQTFRIRPASSDGIELRHSGKGNVLFLDGHIEAVDHEQAIDLKFPNIY